MKDFWDQQERLATRRLQRKYSPLGRIIQTIALVGVAAGGIALLVNKNSEYSTDYILDEGCEVTYDQLATHVSSKYLPPGSLNMILVSDDPLQITSYTDDGGVLVQYPDEGSGVEDVINEYCNP